MQQDNNVGFISEEFEKNVKAFALSDERRPFYKFSESYFREDIKEKKGYVYYSQAVLVFAYSFEKQAYAPKSVLECRVRFLKDHTAFEYPFYDVLGVLNPSDFQCYIFPYIECAERMRNCFSFLANAVKRYLPDILAVAEDEKKLELLKAERTENLKAMFGRFYAWMDESDSETSDFFNENYYSLYRLSFSDRRYNHFLTGNYKKAKKEYLKVKRLLGYEKRLFAFMQSLSPGEKYEAAPPELNTLDEGLKEVKGKLGLSVLLFSLFCITPFLTAVFTFLYLLMVRLVYIDALYVTNFGPIAALEMMLPAILVSILLSYFLRRKISRLLFPKKHEKNCQYDSILNRAHEERLMRKLTYVLATGCLIFLFLTINKNLVFYEDGFKDNLKFFSLKSEYIGYDSVDSIWEISEKKNSLGMQMDNRYYIILLKNGRKLNYAYDVSDSQFEKKIVPLLAEKGVKICYAVTEDEIKLTRSFHS